MTDTWWAIIQRPSADGAEQILVELGDEPDNAALVALRTEYGIPDNWLERRHTLGKPWGFSVAPGEPHPEQMWSRAELNAARQQLETTAGIPGQRDKLDALEEALTAAKATMSPAAWEDLRDSVRKTRRGLRQIALSEIRDQLTAAGVPPSKATVRRRP